MAVIISDNKLRKELTKYKYLNQYVKYFDEHNGQSEDDDYLPKLVVYFRRVLEDKVDLQEFFGWDNDTAEDFYSWGHNSRWANTFAHELLIDLEYYVYLLLKHMKANNIKDFEVSYED